MIALIERTPEPDCYDAAIAWLEEQGDYAIMAIPRAWSSPSGDEGHPAESLFFYCHRVGSGTIAFSHGCGCLTQVRRGVEAQTKSLTLAIRADSRLPDNPDDIRPHHLPIFAEWQRRIDRELGRTPPPPHPDALAAWHRRHSEVLNDRNPAADARLLDAIDATPTECQRAMVLATNQASAANADDVMEAVGQ